jgi:predicted MFS family arabinose efflux permease
VVIAILLVQWRLKLPTKQSELDASKWEKLKRIDFIGAFFLCYSIFAACFVLDVGGQKIPWDSPTLIGILVSGLVSAVCFVLVAKRVKEPIFPLRLITHYDVATNYLIVILQIMVQMALMMTVPVYFQATQNVDTAASGAYLIPAFLGNTLGGLIAGYYIRKTGRYKHTTTMAPVISVISMVLCLVRWNGNTSIWESFYIFPGGLATGMISSSAFVGMAAGVEEGDIAIAGSGMYLCFSMGAVSGVTAGSATYQLSLRSGLERALRGVDGGSQVRPIFAST